MGPVIFIFIFIFPPCGIVVDEMTDWFVSVITLLQSVTEEVVGRVTVSGFGGDDDRKRRCFV